MNLKQAFLALGFVLLVHVSFAQAPPMKWGKIDEQDLKMKMYELDTTAAAVVLADYGEAYFTYHDETGFQLNVKRHVRIKILTTDGLEQANIQIPLFHRGNNEEKIITTKGTTYNLLGGKEEKSKLAKSDVFEEARSEHIKLHKFTLPNVKVGSVIEYEYHKVSDFLYGFENWIFQSTIPTRWSEFRARIPEYYTYKNFMSGHYGLFINETERYQDSFVYNGKLSYSEGDYDRFSATTHKRNYSGTLTPDGTRHRWVMKDVPALKGEAFITNLYDYASKIEFELKSTKFSDDQPIKYYSSDWEKLSKQFMDASSFGGELKKQKQVKELVATLVAGKQTPEEKMQAIYAYVQGNVKYNGQERAYMRSSFKEVLAKKEGNAAEINLLLTAMLREAGLAANPVILSTREHGRINPVIPLEKDFNYAVCHVSLGEQQYLLLDATEPLLPIGSLPYRCMNNQGRIISEEFTSWVPLLNQEKFSHNLSAKLKLSADGTLSGTLSYMRDGYDAMVVRKELEADGEEKYFQSIAGKKGDWLVKEQKFNNLEKTDTKLEEQYTLDIRNKATVAGDRIYLSLLPESLEESNPFKMDTRVFPVNFGCPTESMLMYELELPAGYVVEALPQAAIVSLPDKAGLYRYSVNQMDNKLLVTSTMQIKKPVFGAEEYTFLKEFYQLMLAKQNEQVVLVKQNK